MKKTIIYVLTELDGRIRYVGKTCKKLSRRLAEHLRHARYGRPSHKNYWILSVLSKGYLPKIQMIGEVEGDGCKEERAWIAYGRAEGWDLTNTTDGGEGVCGYKPTAEAIEKARLKNTGRKWSEQERNNHKLCNIGHEVSLTTRNKIAVANTGKHPSEETLEKMKARTGGNAPMFGKHHSEKTKGKMRLSHFGRHPSAETLQRMSVAQKNVIHQPHSEASKQKMKIAQSNRKPITEATRQKMIASHLGKKLTEECKSKLRLTTAKYMSSPEVRQKYKERATGNKFALGNKLLSETCRQMSLSKKGNQYAKGHRWTEEEKKAISLFQKVRANLPEVRAKSKARMMGNKFASKQLKQVVA